MKTSQTRAGRPAGAYTSITVFYSVYRAYSVYIDDSSI